MRKLPFNDDWIIENHSKFKSYRELAEEHNLLFGTDFSRAQMKNHAGLILKVRMSDYWYTEEQKAWIRSEYSKAGSTESKVKAFNEKFGTDRKEHSLREMARRMGVMLSDDALDDYRRRTTDSLIRFNKTVRAKPIGYVGRPANGYLMVKTENGWVSQGRYEYEKQCGEIPKGHVVVFLDGDNRNVNGENLMAIPQSWQALMTAKRFWSEEPNITKTGVLWCRLYLALQEAEGKDNGRY